MYGITACIVEEGVAVVVDEVQLALSEDKEKQDSYRKKYSVRKI
jgi:hypothetical protein